MDKGRQSRSLLSYSRHNHTWELQSADLRRSVAFNPQFLKYLRRLPDELEQIESYFNKDTKPTLSSTCDEAWRDESQHQQWDTREQNLRHEFNEKYIDLKNRYTEKLRKERQRLQQDKENLKEQLEKWKTLASEKDQEIMTLTAKVEELQQQVTLSGKLRKVKERYNDGGPQELQKVREALAQEKRELERFKERHAAISERRVRSDQRKSENTLSTNRQSQLESEYVTDFKDGARLDAVEVITNRAARFGMTPSVEDHLKYYRLVCFIFETAYECAVKAKTSFEKFTNTALDTLSSHAPSIGLDLNEFQRQFRSMRTCTEDGHKAQDALSEVLILVKEEAKTHDLNSLILEVKRAIDRKWLRDYHKGTLPSHDSILKRDLEKYIKFCTRFAWCMVSQVPPLEIEYKNNVYNPRVHVLSQAFSFGEDHGPVYHHRHSHAQIMCYLWPTLQDCQGKVIVKGEVIIS